MKGFVHASLTAAVVSSIGHYTDNAVRFDRYPNTELSERFVSPAGIVVSWFLFTAFAVAGTILLRRGSLRAASRCLGVYSVSGLVGFLHYTAGPLSDFDALQHTFILTDGLTGLAVLAAAVALSANSRRDTPKTGRPPSRLPA